MSRPISAVCHQGFHHLCGYELLDHTTCTCWCHDLPDDLPQCDTCWGIGEVPDKAVRGLWSGWVPCPACNGTGKLAHGKAAQS